MTIGLPALKRLSQSVGVLLIARVSGALATMVTLYLLTQALLPAQVGVVVAAQATGAIGALLSTLNIEGGAIRFVPQWQRTDPQKLWGFLRTLLGTFALVGLPVMAATAAYVLTTTAQDGLVVPVGAWILMALIVPAAAAHRALCNITLGLGAPQKSGICSLALPPLLYALGIGLLAAGNMLTIVHALAVLLSSILVSSGVLLSWTQGQWPAAPTSSPRPPAADKATWRRTGLVLMLTAFLINELPAFVTLLASLTLAPAMIAVFAIMLRFSFLARMVTTAFVMAMSPQVSSHVGAGEMDPAQRLARLCVVLNSGAALLVSGTLMAVAPHLLALFGETYTQGVTAFRLLLVVPLLTAICGPSLMILTAAGANRAILKTTIGALGLLVLTTVIGGRLGGMEGVALGVVITHGLWDIALYRAARATTGIRAWLLPALGDVIASRQTPSSKTPADQTPPD